MQVPPAQFRAFIGGKAISLGYCTPPSPPSSKSKSTSRTPAQDFSKSIKIDPDTYPTLSDDKNWDDFNHLLHSTTRLHGVETVLDPKYKPLGPYARNLFQKHQDFLFAVFSKTLQTDTGQQLVSSYPSDAQKIYFGLLQHATKPVMADPPHTPAKLQDVPTVPSSTFHLDSAMGRDAIEDDIVLLPERAYVEANVDNLAVRLPETADVNDVLSPETNADSQNNTFSRTRKLKSETDLHVFFYDRSTTMTLSSSGTAKVDNSDTGQPDKQQGQVLTTVTEKDPDGKGTKSDDTEMQDVEVELMYRHPCTFSFVTTDKSRQIDSVGNEIRKKMGKVFAALKSLKNLDQRFTKIITKRGDRVTLNNLPKCNDELKAMFELEYRKGYRDTTWHCYLEIHSSGKDLWEDHKNNMTKTLWDEQVWIFKKLGKTTERMALIGFLHYGDPSMNESHLEDIINGDIDDNLENDKEFCCKNNIKAGEFESNVVIVKQNVTEEVQGKKYHQKNGLIVMVPASQKELYEKMLDPMNEIALHQLKYFKSDSMLFGMKLIPFRLRKANQVSFCSYLKDTLASNLGHDSMDVKGLSSCTLDHCYEDIVKACPAIKWMEPSKSNPINGRCKLFFLKEKALEVLEFIDNHMIQVIESKLGSPLSPVGRGNGVTFHRDDSARLDPDMLKRLEDGVRNTILSDEDFKIPGVTLAVKKKPRSTTNGPSYAAATKGGTGGPKHGLAAKSSRSAKQVLKTHGVASTSQLSATTTAMEEKLNQLNEATKEKLSLMEEKSAAHAEQIAKMEELFMKSVQSVELVSTRVDKLESSLEEMKNNQLKQVQQQAKQTDTILQAISKLTQVVTGMKATHDHEQDDVNDKKRSAIAADMTPKKNSVTKKCSPAPTNTSESVEQSLEAKFNEAEQVTKEMEMDKDEETVIFTEEADPGGMSGSPGSQE